MNELKARVDEIRNERYVLKLRLVDSLNEDKKEEGTKNLFELKEETKTSRKNKENEVE